MYITIVYKMSIISATSREKIIVLAEKLIVLIEFSLLLFFWKMRSYFVENNIDKRLKSKPAFLSFAKDIYFFSKKSRGIYSFDRLYLEKNFERCLVSTAKSN